MKISPALKKYVLPNLPYALVFWFACKLGEAWRLAAGTDFAQKLALFSDMLGKAMASPLPSGNPRDWLVGLAGAALVYLVVYVKKKNAKKYRKDVEYGSARWGTPEDIKPYMDEKPDNNIILTQTEGLTMNPRPKNPKYARNKNVLVIGGSGSGKTRFFIKPNLMQMHSSYVVTDPKGSLVIECGKLLARGMPKTRQKLDKNGNPAKDRKGKPITEIVRDKSGKIVYEPYKIKVFNTINFKKSMRYNPFAYIHSEKDILKLVTTLISNTKGEGKSGDDFWVKAEQLLYTALIGYIHYMAPVEEQNFAMLVEMLDAMEVREEDGATRIAV